MTESELLNQKAKLKAMYTQNMNTTRQNSLNEMNADKASYTTDANNQLQEQKDTTLNTKTNADIQAFNNAKKLRELASANGFTNGGELYSGVLQNDQQKANTIGSANSDFSKYKTQWDQKLNEYNTKWNNNLNKLNSETDNAINEYNTKLDMEYQDKINSLRAAAASAARSSSSGSSSSKADASTTKLQLQQAYDYQMKKGNENYPATAQWLQTNQAALMKAGLWDTFSKDFASKYAWVGTAMNDEQKTAQAYYENLNPGRSSNAATASSGTSKDNSYINTFSDYFNKIGKMFGK